MEKNDLKAKEIFEKVRTLTHPEVSASITEVVERLLKHEKDIKENHPEYYKTEIRLGYDCDDRAQIEMFGRRKETAEEVITRISVKQTNIQKNINRKHQVEVDAFEILRKKHPNMFVENAKDFIKET